MSRSSYKDLANRLNGPNGPNGPNGLNGPQRARRAHFHGPNGPNGLNGPNGPNPAEDHGQKFVVPGQSHTLLSTKLLLMVHPGVPPLSGQTKGSVTTPGPKQRWLKNRSKAGSRHPRSGHTSGLAEKDVKDVRPTPHSSQL
eukprot:s824_g20.t1